VGLPPCVAWMLQVPVASNVTVDPDTMQTEGVVCESKLTVRPDVAVALTMNVPDPSTLFESAPKVMVWGVFITAGVFKLTLSSAKSAQFPWQAVRLNTTEVILAPVWSITPT